MMLSARTNKTAEWRSKKDSMIREFGKAVRPFEDPKYKVFREERRKRIEFPFQPLEEHPNIPVVFLEPEDLFPPVWEYTLKDVEESQNRNKIWIKDQEGFLMMLNKLKKATTHITMDMEFAPDRCYEGAHPALMQFSTGTEHFVVDVFPLWTEIYKLKALMEDAMKLKVTFGSVNDLHAWQRYWNIYPTNIVDAQEAYRAVKKGEPIGLDKFASEMIPGVSLNKIYQHADFCVRRMGKLPEKLFNYAVDDVRILWFAWENLKLDLQRCDDEVIDNIRFNCKKVMQNTYKTLRKSSQQLMNASLQYTINEEAFNEIYRWRDYIARALDVFPDIVMSKEMMNKIATSLVIPSTGPRPYHYANKDDVDELYNILKRFTDKRNKNYAQFAEAPRRRKVEIPVVMIEDDEWISTVELIDSIDEKISLETGAITSVAEVTTTAEKTKLVERVVEVQDDFIPDSAWENKDEIMRDGDVLNIDIEDHERIEDPAIESSHVAHIDEAWNAHNDERPNDEEKAKKNTTFEECTNDRERYTFVMQGICMKCFIGGGDHIGRNCPYKRLADRTPKIHHEIRERKRKLYEKYPFIAEHEAKRHYDRHQRTQQMKGSRR